VTWYGSIVPLGNKELVRIVNELAKWLSSEKGVSAVHLPYHFERGGIYLKDAVSVCRYRNNVNDNTIYLAYIVIHML